jgi:hypothetical protein
MTEESLASKFLVPPPRRMVTITQNLQRFLGHGGYYNMRKVRKGENTHSRSEPKASEEGEFRMYQSSIRTNASEAESF